MSMGQLAQYMLRLGSVEAMNLDGGGSTTLVVRDEVVNRPSDGHERRVAAAISVLPP
jgi:exopolysaccharide biosynthesis protein